jgi:putative membrane protein
MANKLQPTLIAVLAILLLVVVIQNAEPTQTRILFFSFTMPRALLLFAAALVGYIMGVLTILRLRR